MTTERNGKFSLREISVMAGIFALGLTGLGWFVSNTVGKDLSHHADKDDTRDGELKTRVVAVENEQKETTKVMYRIEAKQEALAPQHRVDALKPSLRAPTTPPGD